MILDLIEQLWIPLVVVSLAAPFILDFESTMLTIIDIIDWIILKILKK